MRGSTLTFLTSKVGSHTESVIPHWKCHPTSTGPQSNVLSRYLTSCRWPGVALILNTMSTLAGSCLHWPSIGPVLRWGYLCWILFSLHPAPLSALSLDHNVHRLFHPGNRGPWLVCESREGTSILAIVSLHFRQINSRKIRYPVMISCLMWYLSWRIVCF